MPARRLPRGCLVSLAVVAVLALVAGFAIRRALDPDNLRGIAEARLTTLLGQPVKIGRMSFSLLPVPLVSGGDITIGAGAQTAPSMALGRITILPVLSSVFSKPLVIRSVRLEGLTLNVLRDRDGRWLLPFAGASGLPAASGVSGAAGGAAPAPPSAAGTTPPATPSSATPESATAGVDVQSITLQDGTLAVYATTAGAAPVRQAALTDIEAAVERQAGTTTLKGLTGRLGSTTISGAGGANRNGLRLSLAWDSIGAADLPLVFRLLGTAPPTGLVIEGDRPLALDLVVDAAGALSATGRLAARRVSFGTLALSSLESPVRLAKNVLTLDPLTFTAYGGTERGLLSATIAADPVPWRAQSRLQGLDLNAFLSANTSARDKLSGTAQATTNLTGSSAAPLDSMKGSAVVTVANGVIRNFAMLGAINSALKITESAGNDTKFERLSATLAIGGRRITTNDLQLVAGELTVNGAGTVTFDQQLAFDATAVFSRAKSQELIARVRELSGLKNDQGQIVVPLSVTGTASDPRFQIDLARMFQRAAEKELKRQLDRGLKRLFKIPPP